MLGGKLTPLDIISKPCHTMIIISSLELHNNNNKSCLDSPSAPKCVSWQPVLSQQVMGPEPIHTQIMI